MRRECTGCGCEFKPIRDDGREDIKCPYCGGGKGTVTKTPKQRIDELTNKITWLEKLLKMWEED